MVLFLNSMWRETIAAEKDGDLKRIRTEKRDLMARNIMNEVKITRYLKKIA